MDAKIDKIILNNINHANLEEVLLKLKVKQVLYLTRS